MNSRRSPCSSAASTWRSNCLAPMAARSRDSNPSSGEPARSTPPSSPAGAGTYTIQVTPGVPGFPGGDYTIRFAERRPATDADRSMQEVEGQRLSADRLRDAGKPDEALAVLNRAMATTERIKGRDDLTAGLIAYSLGGVDIDRRDFRGAEAHFQRAQSVLERILAADDPILQAVSASMAIVYQRTERRPEGEKLARRALETLERVLGPDHPQVGHALFTLANIRLDAGDHDEAERLDRRAVSIFEATEGADSLMFALLLSNLGNIYINTRQYAQAEPYLVRALAIIERVEGADSLRVAIALQNLGVTARNRKDYARAEEVLSARAGHPAEDAASGSSRHCVEPEQPRDPLQPARRRAARARHPFPRARDLGERDRSLLRRHAHVARKHRAHLRGRGRRDPRAGIPATGRRRARNPAGPQPGRRIGAAEARLRRQRHRAHRSDDLAQSRRRPGQSRRKRAGRAGPAPAERAGARRDDRHSRGAAGARRRAGGPRPARSVERHHCAAGAGGAEHRSGDDRRRAPDRDQGPGDEEGDHRSRDQRAQRRVSRGGAAGHPRGGAGRHPIGRGADRVRRLPAVRSEGGGGQRLVRPAALRRICHRTRGGAARRRSRARGPDRRVDRRLAPGLARSEAERRRAPRPRARPARAAAACSLARSGVSPAGIARR